MSVKVEKAQVQETVLRQLALAQTSFLEISDRMRPIEAHIVDTLHDDRAEVDDCQ